MTLEHKDGNEALNEANQLTVQRAKQGSKGLKRALTLLRDDLKAFKQTDDDRPVKAYEDIYEKVMSVLQQIFTPEEYPWLFEHQDQMHINTKKFSAHFFDVLINKVVVPIQNYTTDQFSVEDRYKNANALSTLVHDVSSSNPLWAFDKFDFVDDIFTEDETDDISTKEELSSLQKEMKLAAKTLENIFLRFSGVLEQLCTNLGDKHELEKSEVDIAGIIEGVAVEYGQMLGGRGPFRVSTPVKIEENTDTNILVNEDLMYLLYMQTYKNARKLMWDRNFELKEKGGIPEDKRKISCEIFQRDGVLFIAITDHSGGIDYTGVLRSARKRVLEALQNGTEDALPQSLRPLSQGSFKSHKLLTLEDVAMFMFEDRITARHGGTGIGLSEVKKILEMHNAHVCPTTHFSDGATFLFAFPKHDIDPNKLRETLESVEEELDKKEIEAIRKVA